LNFKFFPYRTTIIILGITLLIPYRSLKTHNARRKRPRLKKFLIRARPLCRNQQVKNLHDAAYQVFPAQCFKANGQNFAPTQNFASNENQPIKILERTGNRKNLLYFYLGLLYNIISKAQ